MIRSLTGIPTAFKPDAAKRPIVLARSSLNVEVAMADPVMRQALIAQAIGAGGDVFGAGPMRDVTPEPEALPDVPETPTGRTKTSPESGGAMRKRWMSRLTEEDRRGGRSAIVDDELGDGASLTEAEQAGIEDVFGDASGDEDVAIERAWLAEGARQGAGGEGHGDR